MLFFLPIVTTFLALLPLTSSLPTTLEKPPNHLIIVAAHSIPKEYPHPGTSDDSWILEPHQLLHSSPVTFEAHVRAGLKALKSSGPPGTSILLFSGGETRPKAGPRTEGVGYYLVAEKLGIPEGYKPYINTEIYSLDSLQNLLFSICRFYELTGTYPEKITIVSYEFKRKRFLERHARFAGLDRRKVNFIGVDPDDKKWTQVLIGFEDQTFEQFGEDAAGCTGDLGTKRRKRGFGRRGVGNLRSCPAIKDLLMWCGEDDVYPGALPWKGAK